MKNNFLPQEQIGEFLVGCKVRIKATKETGSVSVLIPAIQTDQGIEEIPHALWFPDVGGHMLASKLDDLELI